MAMATPIAPSTIATRQIRLRIAVALSSPWLSAGIALAKIHHLRVGQRRFQLLAQRQAIGSRPLRLLGSFNSSRWLARLPGADRPVRSSAACEIITRGPSPAPAVIRSGSCFSTAAILKFLPAQPQRLAHLRIQPDQKLIGHHRRVAVERLLAGSSPAPTRPSP